jgi:hypothetical protein
MNWKLILLIILISSNSYEMRAQKILSNEKIDHKKLVVSASSIGIVGSGSLIGLYHVWYKKSGLGQFHTFNDCGNWLQMDKAGHMYTSYMISQFTGDLFKWSGISPKKASVIGTSLGFAYQTTLEIFDGLSPDWGFSFCDIGANTLGSILYLGQELFLDEPLFRLKFSSHLTNYAQYRPEILGNNFAERILKDYNGQTYWLSFSPGQFFKQSDFPSWLCLSVGFSADQKLKADSDYFSVNQNGNIYEFNAQREILFSLDIDLSKLPVKSKWAKGILKQINYLKIPFPTLIFSDKKITSSLLYF